MRWDFLQMMSKLEQPYYMEIDPAVNFIQGGTINDPQNILKENSLASGSGQPVISINNTKEIDI